MRHDTKMITDEYRAYKRVAFDTDRKHESVNHRKRNTFAARSTRTQWKGSSRC
jgi:hypothetical protein